MIRRHFASDEITLFTTDAPRFVSNGSVPFTEEDVDFDRNFVAMIDSGAGWNASDLDATFAPLREINGGKSRGKTPFFSSELYDGWVQFDGASFDVTNVSIARVAARMEGLLGKSSETGGGGLSLYMAAGRFSFLERKGRERKKERKKERLTFFLPAPLPKKRCSGGSNFWPGGSTNSDDDSFSAIIQSYDYAAPISEGGSADRQPGYGGPPRASAVRAVLEKFAAAATSPSRLLHSGLRAPAPVPAMPADPPVASYGRVELSQRATLLSALPQLASSPRGGALPVSAAAPLPMELFGQNRGFIAYSAAVPRASLAKPGGSRFEVGGGGCVHDLGTVLVDGVSAGTLDRGKGVGDGGSRLRLREVVVPTTTENGESTSSSSSFAELSIIVGMTGRSNQGTFFDTKGLNGSVLIDGEELKGEWKVWPLPLDDPAKLESVDLALAASSPFSAPSSSLLTVEESGPLLLRGSFEVSAEQARASSVGEWEEGEEGEENGDDGKLLGRTRRSHPADTYLGFSGLSRGVVFVNGIPLGWYDLVEGPQMRVFAPGVWLREGKNDVLVLEMLGAAAGAAVESVLEPDFFGPPKKSDEGKEKGKKSAAERSTSSSSELETSSLLRFPGAGALRRTEAATKS